MHYLILVFVSAIAIVWSFGVQARGVDLIDFSNKPATVNPKAAQDSFDDSLPNGDLAQSMLLHFERYGFGADIEGVNSYGIDLGSLPTRKLFIPRWMRYRRVPSRTIPNSLQGFESGLMQGVFEHCDGARYVPTWWLPRSAETRRAFYFDTVAMIACEHGLPPRLLDAVIAQESGYKPWAISSAGAMGIMQIMPGTARLLDLATPFDPVANLRAGARYLRQQLDRFGRVDLALAAYNAGPERRSLQRGNIPAIPETLNYVRTITTNWARLAALGGTSTTAVDRAKAAADAVRASGYRSVELVRYDGLKEANPI